MLGDIPCQKINTKSKDSVRWFFCCKKNKAWIISIDVLPEVSAIVVEGRVDPALEGRVRVLQRHDVLRLLQDLVLSHRGPTYEKCHFKV